MSLPSCLRCLGMGMRMGRVPQLLFPSINSSHTGDTLMGRSGFGFGGGPPVTFMTQVRWKEYDRRALIDSMPIKDMGTQGEKEADIDMMNAPKENLFPEEDTPNQIFNGIKFSEIPICHIKVSKNNTILHLLDALGKKKIAYRSCGNEGFKNTRKGTNIAAQTTALALAAMAKEAGVTTIRIAIQGLGPGRVSSVKGLQMGGMKIVAIADTTRLSWNAPRARKARRL